MAVLVLVVMGASRCCERCLLGLRAHPILSPSQKLRLQLKPQLWCLWQGWWWSMVLRAVLGLKGRGQRSHQELRILLCLWHLLPWALVCLRLCAALREQARACCWCQQQQQQRLQQGRRLLRCSLQLAHKGPTSRPRVLAVAQESAPPVDGC